MTRYVFADRVQLVKAPVPHVDALFPTFVVEASTLGIPPGAPMPDLIDTNAGNGRPFAFRHSQLGGAMYKQREGTMRLIVIND